MTTLTIDEVAALRQKLEPESKPTPLPKPRPASPRCSYRGCYEDGLYYLTRYLRGGVARPGLYCDVHERQFGDENLRRYEKLYSQ